MVGAGVKSEIGSSHNQSKSIIPVIQEPSEQDSGGVDFGSIFRLGSGNTIELTSMMRGKTRRMGISGNEKEMTQ
jgi:hypothetical protein